MTLPLADAIDTLAQAHGAPEWIIRAASALDSLPAPLVDAEQVAHAVRPYQWLIERCGTEGLPLTQAGRLPPSEVTALMDELLWAEAWIGDSNREHQTAPAARLRESANRLHLVRRANGRLLATVKGRKVAQDPMLLWAHIGAALPLDKRDVDVVTTAARLLWDASQPVGALPEERRSALLQALSPVLRSNDGTTLDGSSLTWLGQPTDDAVQVLSGPGEHRVMPALRRSLAITVLQAHSGRPAPVAPRRRKAPGTVQCHTIKVTLRHVRPPVWRRLRVPSNVKLPALAEVLIVAMGWHGYHLWGFRQGRVDYLLPDPDWPPERDARRYTLGALLPEVGGRAVFEYDFGDGWQHDILVEAIGEGPDEATVIKGKRNCPPEDVGGPWGYQELLDAVADPKHPEREQYLEWVGGDLDPEEFDLADCDDAVKDVRLR